MSLPLASPVPVPTPRFQEYGDRDQTKQQVGPVCHRCGNPYARKPGQPGYGLNTDLECKCGPSSQYALNGAIEKPLAERQADSFEVVGGMSVKVANALERIASGIEKLLESFGTPSAVASLGVPDASEIVKMVAIGSPDIPMPPPLAIDPAKLAENESKKAKAMADLGVAKK